VGKLIREGVELKCGGDDKRRSRNVGQLIREGVEMWAR